MALYANLLPKEIIDFSPAQGSLMPRENPVSPEAGRVAYQSRTYSSVMEDEQRLYAEDLSHVDALKPSMTLFPFSYSTSETNANEASRPENSSPPKAALMPPDDHSIKIVTPVLNGNKARRCSRSVALSTTKEDKMPKTAVQRRMYKKNSHCTHQAQYLLDLYMAHPHLTDALRNVFPDLELLPSEDIPRSQAVNPSNLAGHGRVAASIGGSPINSSKRASELLFFMPPQSRVVLNTKSHIITSTASQLCHTKRHYEKLSQGPEAAPSDIHPEMRLDKDLRFRHMDAHIDPMWHSDFDEQLMTGAIFPDDGDGDFFSAVEQLELDDQMIWVPPSVNMW